MLTWITENLATVLICAVLLLIVAAIIRKLGKDKKKGNKKKPKKDKRDEKIEELNDRLMRNLAEFENFRNRSEKEKSAMFEIGAKSVVEKILPVVDNLERGFDGLSD